MRAAQINNLSGSYGSIRHQQIWDKVAKYQLDSLFVTLMQEQANHTFLTDPQALNPETREFVLSKGIGFGFVRVPEWTHLNEVQYADQLHADLNAYGLNNTRHPAGDPCYVVANAENHEFNIDTFLTAWRKKRPTRATGLAIEGGQGGRIPEIAVAKMNADVNLDVIGEAYQGNMYPQAQDAVKDDLRNRGLKRVKIFYDFRLGAPQWMDGIGWTLETLPL